VSVGRAVGGGGGVFGSAGGQVRGMANLKAVRNRMKSVSSISKITKAMSMVAAAKLRTVQAMQEASRPFSAAMERFFAGMEKAAAGAAAGQAPVGKELTVAITSDRGLCGGVNSSIVKAIKAMLADVKGKQEVEIVLLGDKGRDGLARAYADKLSYTYKDVFKSPVTFTLAGLIAEDIANRQFDTISIFFNKFKNAVSQIVTRRPVYGIEFMKAHAEVLDEYEFDTDLDSAQILLDLFEFQLASQIFNTCLENATSEQAARMSAMDNATRNGTDMLAALTLTYNRQRQAVITSELIEVISGAEALN